MKKAHVEWSLRSRVVILENVLHCLQIFESICCSFFTLSFQKVQSNIFIPREHDCLEHIMLSHQISPTIEDTRVWIIQQNVWQMMNSKMWSFFFCFLLSIVKRFAPHFKKTMLGHIHHFFSFKLLPLSYWRDLSRKNLVGTWRKKKKQQGRNLLFCLNNDVVYFWCHTQQAT